MQQFDFRTVAVQLLGGPSTMPRRLLAAALVLTLVTGLFVAKAHSLAEAPAITYAPPAESDQDQKKLMALYGVTLDAVKSSDKGGSPAGP